MARKSSKTARVMNLLAGGDEVAQNTAESIREETGEVKSERELAEEKSQLLETIKTSSVAVTDEELRDMANVSENKENRMDPVAEAIRDTLESEMDRLEKKNEKEPEIEDMVQPETGELDYAYLNVMENIVGEQVGYFMKQFDVCPCERCVADTKALALTHLPPKYIVTARSTVAPLLNFYSNKYISQVTVELTKACKTVKEIPHHNR